MPISEATLKARRERDLANIEASVARTLAKAPPLTPEQIRKLRGLLRTGQGLPPLPAPRPEPRLETDEEYDTRLSVLLAEELSQCRSCDIQKAKHTYPEHFGHVSHAHEPLSVAQMKDVVEAFSSREHPRLTIFK